MADLTAEAYQQHKENMARRMREMRSRAAEIGPLPGVLNQERKSACETDFQLFCETYRPAAFSMGWSADHLKVLQRIETTVRDGGLFGLAMPRGSGKTTITITAALWALLYGHRRWVCLIGATGPKAQSLLKAIKTELRFNALLLEDFPEVCWPVKCLEGKATRANGQTLNGSETNMAWLAESLTLPTVEGSAASGAVVTVAGITGDIRGQQQTLADGSVIRPDYVILDDPQTRESARSPSQTDDRMATLNGDILGLAGPGVKISGVMPCTVIQRGDMADQILDRELCPEWHGERTQLLYGIPTRMDLWNKYQETREADFRNGGSGEAGTKFYKQNKREMDKGCEAAWDERHNHDEISGIQHAMNLLFRDEAAFWAEFQNLPMETTADDTITEQQLMERINDLEPGRVPMDADLITCFVDVQKELLYYTVTAWRSSDFTGWVLEYGAFPEQGTTNFRTNQARKTFSKMWPGETLEVVLRKALKELTNDLCARMWQREDGAELAIKRLLIDANWGQSRDVVYNFARHTPHRSVIMPSHGKYVGASTEPLNARVAKKPGIKIGTHWRLDKAKDGPVRYCLYDTNHWKTFLFSRFGTEPGTSGSLTLYKARPQTHKTFAKHLKSEYPVRTEGRGREVDEWKLKPDRSDNHWLDCAVGCCVAASVEGAGLVGSKPAATPSKRKRKKSDGVSYL